MNFYPFLAASPTPRTSPCFMPFIKGIPLSAGVMVHFETFFKERFFFMKITLESFPEPLQFCFLENIQS